MIFRKAQGHYRQTQYRKETFCQLELALIAGKCPKEPVLITINRAIGAEEMVRHDYPLERPKNNYIFLSISSIKKHY